MDYTLKFLVMKEFVEVARRIRKVDSKESILTSISNSSCQKRYNKITQGVKTEFLDLIINGNCSIKKVTFHSFRRLKFSISTTVLLKALSQASENNPRKPLKLNSQSLSSLLDSKISNQLKPQPQSSLFTLLLEEIKFLSNKCF